MRKSLLILFIFSISLLSLAEVHIPGGYVEGTWTRENSPYYIEGDIIVYGDYNEIETLTIEPGVQVIFTGHYTFYVDGILYAIGESENMIVFTVQDTTGFSNTDIPDGGWGGLFFSGGRNGARPITGSEIAYCHIEYGKAVGSYDENNGGAIFVANESYVEIHNCEIVNNFAADSGGGIYFESIWSNLSIYDNNISYNNARRGAGIAINSAEITLTDNIISYNEATATDAEEYGFGGGIYCVGYYYPEIEGGRIHHNTAVRGGGLFVSESEPTISSLIVEYNGADIGGGVYCDYYGSPTIEHCKIQNNGADEYGAGIYTDYECNVNLVNCLVIDNTASLNGGGLYTGGGHPVLRNVTFWNNSSVLRVGGAIYCAGANVEIRNGIFWNDYPEEFALVQGSIEATYSDIELATGVYPGEGNLNITPHFRNTDARNLRLAVFDETGSAKNPLVDAGDPNDDYSQEPMPNGHRINMGAYGNTEDATITIHFAGGNIDGEEHWTNEQMQIINQPLVIGAGAILNLDSGLMVNIDNSDVEFIIHGIVRAIGAEGDTIQISPNLLDTTRNISWPGITFADDADNSIIRNVVIENAVNGLDLNHTSSEVRHTRITYDVRAGRENSTGSGIKVASGSEATIDDTEVENYSKGIEVNDASPFITNTRVRNSPESTRDNEVGIEVNGESSPEIDSCNVENFPKGIKVENNQAGTTASPFITNTRVRNSPESTRQTEVGIELSGNGNIEATIENCLIEDYPYAIEYVGNGSLLRTTPTLTNNRLRNSPESTRDNTLVKGIYLENLSSVEIDSCSIEYYPTAIEFVNNARVTSHPVITNSRVRNSPESTRDEYVGMKFTGDIYAEVSENEFVNCDTALITLGTAANGDFNHNLIYMKDSSPIDVAFYAENSSDITFSENTVYNYDYGFYCQDVNGSLENNIIWNTANPIEKLGESTLSVNYNDVEGGYPSRNNLDEDPLFVDAAGE
ncbi:MAG: hypothetical protein B6D62_01820 [Candidatus Cloacimonas sp. 4484_275]|nr:MAG: hypothetical protein B6D62_01820 [Candidatus Cloacimonas sp. 4484_275]